MKINSHCWLRTALQRLQCIFIILWKYSNKRRTRAAALNRGRRLLTIPLHVRRLIDGGAYSGAALIRVNTVVINLDEGLCFVLSIPTQVYKGKPGDLQSELVPCSGGWGGAYFWSSRALETAGHNNGHSRHLQLE